MPYVNAYTIIAASIIILMLLGVVFPVIHTIMLYAFVTIALAILTPVACVILIATHIPAYCWIAIVLGVFLMHEMTAFNTTNQTGSVEEPWESVLYQSKFVGDFSVRCNRMELPPYEKAGFKYARMALADAIEVLKSLPYDSFGEILKEDGTVLARVYCDENNMITVNGIHSPTKEN